MSQSRTMAWGFAAAVMMVACAMIPRADGASSRPPTVGELAARVGAAEYYMLPDRGVELVDGVLVGMDDLEGEFFTPNRRLSRGVYHNFTSEVIRLTLGDAVYDVAPGGVVG
ncbi:MAG TPA: hypothetical protein PKU91_06870, partial [Phycisphaerales bacterium]|nr:hypothetical protein [Phycisphaerales bacterium]